MPLTLSVSSVMAVTSARLCCVSVLMPRRILPTRCVSNRKKGRTASEMRVSCQLSQAMATSVTPAVMRLLKTELAVSVTTVLTPPTSFDSRLWISPVRVSVKKRRGIRCKCPYRALRRSCITLWPTTLLTYV